MVYLFLISVLIIIGLFLWSLVLLVEKNPRLWLGIITVICISLFSWYKNYTNQFHLSFIPYGMNVSKILYVKEESWGLGPGGNETGIIEYELPDSVAKKIGQEGLSYFKNLPVKPRKNNFEKGYYGEWQSTPISPNSDWGGARSELIPNRASASINNYLARYGFEVPIDINVTANIDYAISKQGSYFAYTDGGGVLIVVPETHRVFFAYSG